MSETFRKNHEPTTHLVEQFRREHFPTLPPFRSGRWTTPSGESTWCIFYEGLTVYPDSIMVNSITGPRFAKGWRAEVAADTDGGDSFEFRGWEEAFAYLCMKAVDRIAKDVLRSAYLKEAERLG